MDWIDYREKLGIGFNDDEKTILLRNKIANFLQTQVLHGSIDFYEDSLYLYFDMVGETRGFSQNPPAALLADSICSSETIQELISKYVALINTYKNPPYNPYEQNNYKDVIKGFFLNALETSKIPFQMFEDEDGMFVFPKGAAELDNALVSQPLEWLNSYPLARVAFAKALKNYSDTNDENSSEIADDFRKSLETFFQEFFKKSKSLENMKSDYGSYLKSHGVPSEISNNFESVLKGYTDFNNNYAKHHAKTNKNVLEYIMYQTGNIIRLLITLSEEEAANAN